MLKIFGILTVILISAGVARSQSDNVGSGRSIKFDGVNDYINLSNVYDNLTLPITISAWIKLEDKPGFSGIFASQDNLPLYNGFQFVVSSTTVSIEYGDGMGENLPEYRRSKGASVPDITQRWIHVAATMRGATDMNLYVNGIDVGGSYSGSSNLPMSSSSPGDVAKIGSWLSNGIHSPFKGEIDELTLWNRSLTITEIRAFMCKKLVGSESGLIGYWSFNELSGNTAIDKSSNAFNGTLIDSPQRVFSGAPMGDESANRYASTWTGTIVTLSEGIHITEVSNVQGSPQGLHIYTVRNSPSQTQGLNEEVIPPYFGVFIAALDVNNTFDVSLDNDSCGIFTRTDNAEVSWTVPSGALTNIIDRNELIGGSEVAELNIDLGPDELVCPFIPRTLSPVANPAGYQFLWQNGSTQTTFLASDYGVYWVMVSNACQVGQDTVTFAKQNLPFSIDLGPDELICPLESRVLSPLTNPTGFEFTWQDGSKQSSFQVSDYGTYWVTIGNSCFTVSDTITIQKPEFSNLFIPNVITPNNDSKNQYFVIDDQLIGSHLYVFNRWGKRVYQSDNYQNNWDGKDLPAGIYFYFIKNSCTEDLKGYLSIVR